MPSVVIYASYILYKSTRLLSESISGSISLSAKILRTFCWKHFVTLKTPDYAEPDVMIVRGDFGVIFFG